jgi:hypothetical protein
MESALFPAWTLRISGYLFRNDFTAISSATGSKLDAVINQIWPQQAALLDLLNRGDLSGAKTLQQKLDRAMHAAERRWKYDPTVLNLAGYHRKNAYCSNTGTSTVLVVSRPIRRWRKARGVSSILCSSILWTIVRSMA